MNQQIVPRLPYLLVSGVFLYLINVVPELRSLSVINLSSLIIFEYILYKIQGKFLTPYNLFMAVLYLFHSGQLWVALYKPDVSTFITSMEYTGSVENSLMVYKLITKILIIFMSVGVLTIKKVIVDFNKKSDTNYKVDDSVHYLVLVAYAVSMYYEFLRAQNVSALGYGAGYHYTNTTALILSDFVNVLLYLMLYLCKDDQKLFKRYLILLFIRALFVMIFVGNRGDSVINILIAVFLLINYSYLSVYKKKIRNYVVISGLFLLFILPIISMARSGDSFNLAEINPVESFLMEFGDTAGNVFYSVDFVNQYSHFYGMQMLMTSLTIVPFSTVFFGDVIASYGNIGMILNEYRGYGGLGGSLISQLYMNFGDTFYLLLVSALFSLLVSWISNSLMTKKLSFYKMLIFLSLFAGVLTNVRSEWITTMSFLKIALYVILMIYIFNSLGINIINRKTWNNI